MSDALRVRLYDVRFGDAILVTVPDRDEAGRPLDRHLLIDVGNVLAGEGGDDDVYREILEDIVDVTGERGVDLYVMTHEHLDHIQGMLHGATRIEPPVTVPVDTAWLTASADPTYYERFTDAKRKLDAANAVYTAIARTLAASDEPDDRLATLVENNNPRKSADCVAFLRDHLTSPDRIHYVHRGFDPTDRHPFRDAELVVLAPEEDTSDYYGRFRPMTLGRNASLPTSRLGRVVPPPGVDLTAFENLVENRRRGVSTNALAIDKAKNNTSVVFTLRWRGRTLLFAGDAELRSWRTMEREDVLVPVDVIKVSHHGSHNGTPSDSILDAILPLGHDGPRVAAISTCLDTYESVPDDATTERLAARCDYVVSTEGVGGCVDVEIDADGAITTTTHATLPGR